MRRCARATTCESCQIDVDVDVAEIDVSPTDAIVRIVQALLHMYDLALSAVFGA